MTDEIWQSPGERIKALRERLGLTQTDLAALLDVSNVTVNRWERGRMRPSGAGWHRFLALEQQGIGRQERSATSISASSTHRPGNLPAAITRFIGRQSELETVTRLCATRSIVTVTGPGGIGKTRLAVEASRGLADRFPDGIWLVDLAPLTDATLIAPTLARTLSVREGSRQSLLDRITTTYADQQILLILDNCEHLITECAEIVTVLTAVLRESHVLVTSRTPLDLPGEVIWTVPPLPTSDGTELFCDRAQLRHPSLTLDERQQLVIAEICNRLDGLPLAIELAAARTPVLSVSQIADRLDRRFELLRTESRLVSRQRALDATISWSYDLLSSDEQRLFTCLGIFADSFTIEAVEAVFGDTSLLGGKPNPPLSTLNLLDRLVRQSLVIATADVNGTIRFRLLESLADFARSRLHDEDPDQRFAERHARYYATLASETVGQRRSTASAAWLVTIDREQAHVVAALEWAITHAPMLAVRLAAALWHYWRRRARFIEGARLLDRTISAAQSVRSSDVVEVLIGAAILHARLGKQDKATAFADEALSQARAINDESAVTNALCAVGLTAEERDDFGEAERAYQEAEDRATALRNPHHRAVALNGLGRVATHRGDLDAADSFFADAWSLLHEIEDIDGEAGVLLNLADVATRAGRTALASGHYERALPLIRTLDDPQLYATALANLAELRLATGDAAQAVCLATEALDAFRTSGHRSHLASTLYVLGVALEAVGQPRAALDRLREALALYHRLGAIVDAAQTMEALARLLIVFGRLDQAARSLGAAEAIRESASVEPYPMLDYAGTVSAVRETLGATACEQAWAAGRNLTANQAIVEVLTITIPEPAEPLTSPRSALAELTALTPRQTEILRLVATGQSNREIARLLSISERTVERHLTAAFTVLGVDRRSSAVAVALHAGLLGDIHD